MSVYGRYSFIVPDDIKVSKIRLVDRIWYRVLLCAFTLLLSALAVLYGTGAIICYGPSPMARDIFVLSMLNSDYSAFIPYIYLPESKILDITEANRVFETDARVDSAMIKIARNDAEMSADAYVFVNEIKEQLFSGAMMVIPNPAWLSFGSVINQEGKISGGEKLDDMIARYGGVGGVGLISDPGDKKNMSAPDNDASGVFIRGGELIYGARELERSICGFDGKGKFITGKMTAEEALKAGIRDGLDCSNVLLVNGKASLTSGVPGGLGARTAIGQKSDGSVLILVTNGLYGWRPWGKGFKFSECLGAGIQDVMDIMLEYGAVNAALLGWAAPGAMVMNGARVDKNRALTREEIFSVSAIIKASIIYE